MSKTLTAVVSFLLGSVVVAAIVNHVGNIRLEKYKKDVELRFQEVSRRRSNYLKLRVEINDFARRMDDLVRLGQLWADYRDKKFAGYVQTSIDKTSDQMAVVYTANTERDIDESIRRKVNEILDGLGPQLQLVQKDAKRLPGLTELYEAKLKAMIVKAQELIENRMKTLTI